MDEVVFALPDATITVWQEDDNGNKDGDALFSFAFCQNVRLSKSHQVETVPACGQGHDRDEVVGKRYQLSIGCLYLKQGWPYGLAFDEEHRYWIEVYLEEETGRNETYRCHTCTPVNWENTGNDPEILQVSCEYKPEWIEVV